MRRRSILCNWNRAIAMLPMRRDLHESYERPKPELELHKSLLGGFGAGEAHIIQSFQDWAGPYVPWEGQASKVVFTDKKGIDVCSGDRHAREVVCVK